MNACFTPLILLGMAAAVASEPRQPGSTPPAGEPAAPAASAAPTAPAPDQLAAMIRLRGKPGKPSTNVMTATRSDDDEVLTVAALAPAFDGITHVEKPRFWWFQSAETRAGELQFVLTEIRTSGPAELLRVEVPPMKAGHHFIDLSDPKTNPGQCLLDVGSLYQWTFSLRSERGTKAVFCRLRRETSPASIDDPLARFRVLNENRNWYELFDFAAGKAAGGDSGWITVRNSLVEWVGLADALKP